jgi:hypothetical protein
MNVLFPTGTPGALYFARLSAELTDRTHTVAVYGGDSNKLQVIDGMPGTTSPYYIVKPEGTVWLVEYGETCEILFDEDGKPRRRATA